MVKSNPIHKHPNIFERLLKAQKLLKEISVSVYIVDIYLGTQILQEMILLMRKRESWPDVFLQVKLLFLKVCPSLQLSKLHALQISYKSWQRKWDEESTGRHTYDLIPVVGTYPEV